MYMRKKIVQFLLENQGFVSLDQICKSIQQPRSIVKTEIEKLDVQFPQLLYIKLTLDNREIDSVKIADYQDELAKSLL